MPYEPMSRDALLARGSCCKYGCQNCPYGFKKDEEEPQLLFPRHHFKDPRVEAALKEGRTAVIYSDRQSLKPFVILLGRVKIIYKNYVAS